MRDLVQIYQYTKKIINISRLLFYKFIYELYENGLITNIGIGSCGSNCFQCNAFLATIKDDDDLRINYVNEMKDVIIIVNNILIDGLKATGAVTIPKGVTCIGDLAFYSARLTSVTIPEGVTTIGASAFQYCKNLTNITIPGSVKSIGNYAFSNCTDLTIKIPQGVTGIGQDAFYKCKKVTWTKN